MYFLFSKENYTSLQKIKDKQGHDKAKTFHGSFICYNQSCPSVSLNQATHGRDTPLATAIAFSGACSAILSMPCPPFNSKSVKIMLMNFIKVPFFSGKETGSSSPSITSVTSIQGTFQILLFLLLSLVLLNQIPYQYKYLSIQSNPY